jgi:hypothetical protein
MQVKLYLISNLINILVDKNSQESELFIFLHLIFLTCKSAKIT